jgi:hypothetical protein
MPARLRLVLGHVHRQQHELPDGSAGYGLPYNGTALARSERVNLARKRWPPDP